MEINKANEWLRKELQIKSGKKGIVKGKKRKESALYIKLMKEVEEAKHKIIRKRKK